MKILLYAANNVGLRCVTAGRQVKVTRSSLDEGGVETLIRTLERGEFFGERALQSYVHPRLYVSY